MNLQHTHTKIHKVILYKNPAGVRPTVGLNDQPDAGLQH